MARLLRASVLLALLGLAASAGSRGSSAGASADGSDLSMNPIRRVVSMLTKMVQKVEEEAKKEEELYDKFICYCRTSGGDLASSIAESTAKVPQVQHDIEEGEAELVGLKQAVKSHQEDRASAKSAMEAATGQREGEHKVFVETSTEYQTYLNALGKAIPAIMKGMSGGALLQSETATSSRQLQQAVVSSTSVTEYDRQMVTAFLAGKATDSNNYVPKGGEIVGILKSIQEDFQKSHDDVTAAETESVKVYGELMAARSKQVQTLSDQIEKKIQRTGDLQVEIINMKNELTGSEAALVADQALAAELGTTCESKEGEWQERQKVRSDELIALHETIKLLNDDDALELFKKTLPSASLLQVKDNAEHLKKTALAAVERMPRSQGGRKAMDFLMLALSGKKVDFSKVIKMVDDMVSLLKQEQVDDDAKKEYCELQIDSTEDKIKNLSKKVEDLEIAIEEKAEATKTLEEELAELAKGVAALDKNVAEETEMRKEEHTEFNTVMQDNSAAKELLSFAKNRLNKFYNPKLYQEAPALNEQDGAAPALVQIRLHGFEPQPAAPGTWEGGYEKKGQETTGVINMIDRLIKDLDKEMIEAETEEKNSQKAYEELTADAAAKRAADVKSIAAKQKAKADFEEGKVADETEHQVTGKELQAVHMYSMDLHQECDWLQQNFDLRKQARADEMDSLNQAKAILSGADFSLLQAPAAKRLRGA